MLSSAIAPSRSEQASDVAGEPARIGQARIAGPGDERVGVLIPLAARIIIAEDRSIGLGFVGKTECQVTFDKPLQRFRDMSCRLVIIDNAFKTVHRSQILAPSKIVAADLHLLPRQMITRKV